jgi:uncharacterized membrane protein YdfJ with MMPL/SSD domain
MNTTAQANFETARLTLIESIAKKLIPAREQLEEARRALQKAVAVLRNPHAPQHEKVKARAAQAEAQRDLTTATAECSRLEAEADRARTGTHPELARAVVAAQHEHLRQRTGAIKAAEARLRDALTSAAVTDALQGLEEIHGRPVARKIAADLLVKL